MEAPQGRQSVSRKCVDSIQDKLLIPPFSMEGSKRVGGWLVLPGNGPCVMKGSVWVSTLGRLGDQWSSKVGLGDMEAKGKEAKL
jgi:hypothetical protein